MRSHMPMRALALMLRLAAAAANAEGRAKKYALQDATRIVILKEARTGSTWMADMLRREAPSRYLDAHRGRPSRLIKLDASARAEAFHLQRDRSQGSRTGSVDRWARRRLLRARGRGPCETGLFNGRPQFDRKEASARSTPPRRASTT